MSKAFVFLLLICLVAGIIIVNKNIEVQKGALLLQEANFSTSINGNSLSYLSLRRGPKKMLSDRMTVIQQQDRIPTTDMAKLKIKDSIDEHLNEFETVLVNPAK